MKNKKIFIGIIIVIVLAGGLLFRVLDNKYHFFNKEVNSVDANITTNIPKSEEKTTIPDYKTGTGYRTIALLGLDSRGDYYAPIDRTDCVMLAIINQETKEATIMSIFRDTYVEMELDGVTKLNKINQAYYNEVENTLATINKNLDLNVTEYTTINFSSLYDIIDAIGGVEIEVDADELQYINPYIKDVAMVAEKPDEKIDLKEPGTFNLNGVQAVAYCRIRYTEGGDYKRTERMREVFQQATDKIKKLNATELYKLIEKLLPEVRTNIPVSEIPSLTQLNITNKFGWPYETEGVYMQNEYNESDFYGPPVTLESNVERLHKEVYHEENYVVPDSVKEISEKIIKKTGKK